MLGRGIRGSLATSTQARLVRLETRWRRKIKARINLRETERDQSPAVHANAARNF